MKRWRIIAGSTSAVLIMAAVLYCYGGDLGNVDFRNRHLPPGLAAAVSLYVIVIIFGAFGWRMLLTAFRNPPAPFAAERQLLLSQIAKYIPGNVAHYLGRAAMTIHSGVPATIVGFALATEVAATVAGGLLSVVVAIVVTPEIGGTVREALPKSVQVSRVSALAAAFVFATLCIGLIPLLRRRLKGLPDVRFRFVLVAALLYSVSFLLLGVSLRLIAGALGSTSVPLSLSVALFAAAWIAGLITPGAPGGLGVRESILTIGLAPILGGPTALAAALLHRGVSVLGDGISFGVGLLLPKRETPRHSPAVARQET